MGSILLTITVVFVFFGCVLLLWTAIQLIAEKRLGFRKLGCKGPVRGEQGEMTCCRGDRSSCEELENAGQTGESSSAPPHP